MVVHRFHYRCQLWWIPSMGHFLCRCFAFTAHAATYELTAALVHSLHVDRDRTCNRRLLLASQQDSSSASWDQKVPKEYQGSWERHWWPTLDFCRTREDSFTWSTSHRSYGEDCTRCVKCPNLYNVVRQVGQVQQPRSFVDSVQPPGKNMQPMTRLGPVA